MRKISLLLILTGSLLVVGLIAQMNHGSHTALQSADTQADRARAKPAMPKKVQNVLDNYLKIQTALAQDSLQGISESSAALSKSIKSETANPLSAAVSEAAESLVRAEDLKAARQVFKPLSAAMLKYLNTNHALVAPYVEVYCPMAKAGWIQKGASIRNPYFGKAMAECGQIIVPASGKPSVPAAMSMPGCGNSGMSCCPK